MKTTTLLTRKERNRIYKRTLAILNGKRGTPYGGICHCIAKARNIITANVSLSSFPEIYDQKPSSNYREFGSSTSYWWKPIHSEDVRKKHNNFTRRVKILEQAIERTS